MSQTEKLSQPWLKWLEEDSKYFDEGSWQMDLYHILTKFLQSENSDAVYAARQVHTNYSQLYVAQHEYVLSCLDKGMDEYLSRFYDILFSTVRFIPYDDPKQEKVVQLLIELHNIPAQPFIVDNVSTLSIFHMGTLSNIDR